MSYAIVRTLQKRNRCYLLDISSQVSEYDPDSCARNSTITPRDCSAGCCSKDDSLDNTSCCTSLVLLYTQPSENTSSSWSLWEVGG